MRSAGILTNIGARATARNSIPAKVLCAFCLLHVLCVKAFWGRTASASYRVHRGAQENGEFKMNEKNSIAAEAV
jgi:hypothetical protein